MITSNAFGPLAAALRRADAHHHDLQALLPRLVAARPIDDADDPAAVLHHRLATATARRTGSSRPRPAPRLIVGLIPDASGPMTAEMRHALDDRKHLIEQRARALAERAITNHQPWTRALGSPPRNPNARKTWELHVQTIAAYRDRYHITSHTILGATPETGSAQAVDVSRARAAATDARRVSMASQYSTFSSAPRADRRPPTPSL